MRLPSFALSLALALPSTIAAAAPTASPAPSPKASRGKPKAMPRLLSATDEKALDLRDGRAKFEAAKAAAATKRKRLAAIAKANPGLVEVQPAAPLLLPQRFNWRDEGIMSPIRDQGSYGTCWAFGTIGVMESLWFRQHRDIVDLSEQDLVNCNCRKCDDSEGTPGKRLAGVRVETANPYVGDGDGPQCKDSNCGPCQISIQTPYRFAHEYVPVNPDYTTPEHELDPVPTIDIKRALLEHGPIYTKMHIPNGSAFGAHKGTGTFDETKELVYEPTRNVGAHMIVIVGWDDAKGAWLMRNSWGTDWGDDGYGWIKYGSNKIGMGAVWSEMRAPSQSYNVIWTKQMGQQKQIHGWELVDARLRDDELRAQGYRIESLDIEMEGGRPQYGIVWRKAASIDEMMVLGISVSEYQTRYAELAQQGWRVHLVEPYVVGGAQRVAAVWRKDVAEQEQVVAVDRKAFDAKDAELRAAGWRLHLLEPFVVANATKFTAVWRKGSQEQDVGIAMSHAAYKTKREDLAASGWRVKRLETHTVRSKVFITAIWEKSNVEHKSSLGISYEDFRKKDAELADSGWRVMVADAF